MNTNARVVANTRINGQRYTRNINLDYASYRDEALRRWEAHTASLPDDHPDREAAPPEVTTEDFTEATYRVAYQVAQEPWLVSTNPERGTAVVVPHPEYVEVIFGATVDLVLPERGLVS